MTSDEKRMQLVPTAARKRHPSRRKNKGHKLRKEGKTRIGRGRRRDIDRRSIGRPSDLRAESEGKEANRRDGKCGYVARVAIGRMIDQPRRRRPRRRRTTVPMGRERRTPPRSVT